MKKIQYYIAMARPDYWIKNIFILPGTAIAFLETNAAITQFIQPLLIGIISTCFMSSANYVINEFLDAKYDFFHPTKKSRPAVSGEVSGMEVLVEYFFFAATSLILAYFINVEFLITLCILGVCGIFYNVEPLRLKDLAYVDVLFESLNIVIRLLLGWFVVTQNMIPPLSLMIAYWMAGAFLMAAKRYAEYRQIGDPALAAKYRKSFGRYTERSLLMSSMFYALTFAFHFGIFLFKYRIEYILTFPMFSALFVWYFGLTINPNSPVRDPEKMYREGTLMIYIVCIVVAIVLLSFFDIPILRKILMQEYYK